MQFVPVSPTEALIREVAYVHPDAGREMRAPIPESALPQPPPRGWSHG